ncbi:Membrane associated serine protease, rhomboid family [Muriicola jejuensis]|uniref:Rhomboid family intramembrane serine protease n=1 Tax=Muriicola jejuensis TaxID=504488 RepID=A0A6P0UF32_9FLAO|nr:rhomboid family intramembrane serine protease [Muriicola jejuensis]NER10499.1 rhomboid family intramembrane serine protease [Muriicola jejuensis]SMP18491.1 Membrane associated serine protease, rhomboid family [Muriicola jejuensis]
MSSRKTFREESHFKFTNSVLAVPMAAVLLIWTVFWLELEFRINWNDLGIYPRTISGLRGVIFGPFLHASIEHLYNNTIPLAILLSTLMYFYRSMAFKLLFWGLITTGLITWLIGRPAYHIGASGLIYLLASFIFFKGIFTRHYRLVAVSLVVSFIYGSMLWYIFPVEDGISWEGHLGGFLVGLFAALLVKVKVPEIPKYAWEREDYDEEEDEFLKHFDEEGNFIEKLPEEPEEEIRITYHYRKGDPNPPSDGD